MGKQLRLKENKNHTKWNPSLNDTRKREREKKKGVNLDKTPHSFLFTRKRINVILVLVRHTLKILSLYSFSFSRRWQFMDQPEHIMELFLKVFKLYIRFILVFRRTAIFFITSNVWRFLVSWGGFFASIL